ncbi:hypothetical protein NPIL_80681 [Nephila pilipes]|uniref:Uncharacterized protein n=1 Tax=Nephila pilipes TaxID=299642 RepID=A0A8X6T692_NEPPI|nr:hypothetical protein NPIL_80681 [Nephila pilipes]
MEVTSSNDANDLDLEMCPEVSHVNDIQKEIYVPKQNIQLFDFKSRKAVSLEKLEDVDYRYSCIVRYSLLQSVMASDFPQRLRSPFDALVNNQLFRVSEVINMIDVFFYKDFDKIRFLGASEVECAEFYLSRCVMLCGEPKLFNFMFLASFVTHIFLDSVCVVKCFRKLYLCEFIFDVLYRRTFWKFFDDEGFRELMSFCDDFKNCFATESSLSELENTTFGVEWINRVKNVNNTVGDSFSLNESEIELFRKSYSIENNRDYKSALSQVIEKDEYFSLKKSENDILVCAFCDSKCYNYMDYMNHFI